MLGALEEEARAYVQSLPWAPPVADMPLAFGVGRLIGLFLLQFERPIERGEAQGDTEAWVVVGDLPSVCFESDVRTPADALRLYCAICQDWADNVLAGSDLSQSYPIRATPTPELAEMLKSRIAFIREELIPLAGLPRRRPL